MIKTYITGISQHTRTELLQLWYQPDGFELEHNRKTSFPIIPVIAEQYQPGDDVKIIAIRPDNLDTPDNYQLFFERVIYTGDIRNRSDGDLRNRESGRTGKYPPASENSG